MMVEIKFSRESFGNYLYNVEKRLRHYNELDCGFDLLFVAVKTDAKTTQ
jgi:hypothetical protein